MFYSYSNMETYSVINKSIEEWLINHFSIDFYYLENNILKLYNGIILNKKGRL